MFVDDDIAGVPAYAKELFRKLIPLGIKWVSQAGIGITKDDELLSLASRAGARCCSSGFESMDEATLKAAHKYQNNPRITRMRSRNCTSMISFSWRLLCWGSTRTAKTCSSGWTGMIRDSKADTINVNILYPYPGTEIRERLAQEGRVTSDDWTNYVYSRGQLICRRT